MNVASLGDADFPVFVAAEEEQEEEAAPPSCVFAEEAMAVAVAVAGSALPAFGRLARPLCPGGRSGRLGAIVKAAAEKTFAKN